MQSLAAPWCGSYSNPAGPDSAQKLTLALVICSNHTNKLCASAFPAAMIQQRASD